MPRYRPPPASIDQSGRDQDEPANGEDPYANGEDPYANVGEPAGGEPNCDVAEVIQTLFYKFEVEWPIIIASRS